MDTSVWIDFLRGTQTQATGKLEEVLADERPFGITSHIYQEILQGADSDVSFARFDAYFRTQVFYHPSDAVESFAAAARIYNRCRKAGFTIRSTIDCLIAQIAIEQEIPLLHSDRDFDQIAAVVPELVIA